MKLKDKQKKVLEEQMHKLRDLDYEYRENLRSMYISEETILNNPQEDYATKRQVLNEINDFQRLIRYDVNNLASDTEDIIKGLNNVLKNLEQLKTEIEEIEEIENDGDE